MLGAEERRRSEASPLVLGLPERWRGRTCCKKGIYGSRFEFRAVGSEANCASSLIVLNAAVAEALEDFKTREIGRAHV